MIVVTMSENWLCSPKISIVTMFCLSPLLTEVNEFFIDKIRKLKNEFEILDNTEPLTELKAYLSKKHVPNEGFHLKELTND